MTNLNSVLVRRRWAAASAALLLLTLGACSPEETRVGPGQTLHDGVLSVGTSSPFAPLVFPGDDGELTGFDIEVLRAVGDELGLAVEFTQTPFRQLLPGILERRYDVAARGLFDTKDRAEKYTLVSYFSAGTQWLRRTASDLDPLAACGRKVGAENGTTQFTTELPAKSLACTDDGAAPIEIIGFDDFDNAVRALRDNEIDAVSADSPAIGWAAKQSAGALETAGAPFDTTPYVFAVIHRASITDALRSAVQKLIDDGRMRTIAEKWGMTDGLIATSEIRGKNEGGR